MATRPKARTSRPRTGASDHDRRRGRMEKRPWFGLERAMGFEPTTPTLARLCSTPELHPLDKSKDISEGAPRPQPPDRFGRTRIRRSRAIRRGCKPLDRFPAGCALVACRNCRRSLLRAKAAKHAFLCLRPEVWAGPARRAARTNGVASCNFKIADIVARAIETSFEKALTGRAEWC